MQFPMATVKKNALYNCDETGCTTVQKCPKVVASKHCCQVGQVTSAERGTLVTVCFAVNAKGMFYHHFLSSHG
jgi:hypothetical protein